MWSEFVAANAGVAYFFAGWLALCVGSFLNVVIYRLPVMMQRDFSREAKEILELPADDDATDAEPFNLMVPRSRCPKCEHAISAWQNIPVISWLFLRGKCAGCATPIAARYPLVEALTCLMGLVVVYQFGFGWLAGALLVATWMLIAMAFIDYDTFLLPDQLTLPLLWLGLIVNLWGGITSLESAVIGAMVGYLLLWSVYWVFKLITKKEGMGYGDFKLLAALGAWMGWQILPALVLVASVLGVLYAIATGLFAANKRGNPMPFGPFLAAAGWVCLLARDSLIGWYGFHP